MGQLLFKKIFWDSIRDGSKTTTVRRWTSPRLKAGQRAYSPGIGWLKIEAVDVIDLARLGENDAKADGFASVAEMKRMLRELYPNQAGDGRQWFRVAFSPEPNEGLKGQPAVT
jgi:hypothetical protein